MEQPAAASAIPPEHALTREDASLHGPRLLRFAQRLTRSQADAEDLLQDTFLRAHQRFHHWEPGTNLHGWLSTIMMNLFRNNWAVRRRRGETALPTDDLLGPLPPNQEYVVSLHRATAGLASLSTPHRAVMELAMDGLSYEEIAAQLGLPIGTVRSRLSRARSALRRQSRIG